MQIAWYCEIIMLFVMTAVVIMWPSWVFSADIKLNRLNETKVEATVFNISKQRCTVSFVVKYYGSVTSNGNDAWHDALRANAWVIEPGDSVVYALEKEFASDWDISDESVSCVEVRASTTSSTWQNCEVQCLSGLNYSGVGNKHEFCISKGFDSVIPHNNRGLCFRSLAGEAKDDCPRLWRSYVGESGVFWEHLSADEGKFLKSCG